MARRQPVSAAQIACEASQVFQLLNGQVLYSSGSGLATLMWLKKLAIYTATSL